jgi:hypothetical protein
MKLFLLLSMLLVMLTLTSCGVVETIFKAGMWWAFILIALVVGIILYVVFKAKKK